MAAAYEGNLPLLKILIDKGAEFDLEDLSGRSLVGYTAEGDHVHVMKYLKSLGVSLGGADLEGNTPLLIAARKGHVDVVKYLVRRRSDDVNACGIWDLESPLTNATKSGYAATARHLLEAGGDPLHRDALGMSPLDYAILDKPVLREMHQAHHFHDHSSRKKAQPGVLLESIRSLLCATDAIPNYNDPERAVRTNLSNGWTWGCFAVGPRF